MNPYKKIDGIYADSKISEYKEVPLGDLPPHVFAIANEAYQAMWKKSVVCLACVVPVLPPPRHTGALIRLPGGEDGIAVSMLRCIALQIP